MSVKAMYWAFEVELDSPSAKLVLLALADHADETGKCWPSQETLAKKSAQSIDSVQRRLKELVSLGLLTYKNRRRASSLYQIQWSANLKPLNAVPSSKEPQIEVKEPQNGLLEPHSCGTEPSIRTTNIEPSKKKEVALCAPSGSTSDWPHDYREQVWKRYPRKIAKKSAMKALEKVHRSGDVPWSVLIAALDKFCAWAKTKEIQYIKHPASWINGGCWDDELTAGEFENGHQGPRPLQDDRLSASRAAGRLAEAAERGEFRFEPIPSLLPKTSADDVKLLSEGRGAKS